MTLSLLVTHYKTPELLKLCLKNAEEALERIEHEIIVVDSEAQDDTKEIMREDYPDVHYFPFLANVGYATLANKGLKKAQGEYIFLINADIILNQDAVQKLLHYLSHNPKVGMVGPALVNFNGLHQDSCFRYYKPITIACRRSVLGKLSVCKSEIDRFLMKSELRGASKKEGILADWLMGSALCMKRDVVKKVGEFDKRFFMYFEDVDWCKRFWQNGYKVVYLPEASITHYHQRASRKWGGVWDVLITKQARIHLVSAVKFFLKHGIFPTRDM